ncbi:peptidase [Virgibacillus phasianinus]|uniref:Peptidase n=2 Tax=Virgibacillus phasianinus TaxID=2017483 RepID=A0A220U467_9BACI|nr:peptidase [Virgibacillus phasianinus]
MFVNSTVHAESMSDLKSKQSEVHNERSSVKANLSDAEAKIADVMIDLKERNNKIEKVEKALKQNQAKMDETKVKVNDTKDKVNKLEEEVKTLEDEIEARYEILKDRIVSYQKSGGNIGYMDVIFGSKSFGEFISRVSAVNKITNSDEELMKEQEKAKKEVEEKQDKVEKKLEDLKEMKTELEGMKETILVQKEKNEEAKAELKDKKENLVAMKEELQIKDSSLAAIETEVSDSIAQKNIEQERAVAAAEVADAEKDHQNDTNDDSGKLATLSSKSSSDSEQKKTTQSEPSVSHSGSGGVSAAINAGFPYIGTPYVWNGESPSGFDCSGFIAWAFRQGGISLPSSTSALQSVGSKVSYSNAQPGDLVFFNTYKTNGHVGIYLGGGKFIGAQNSTGLAVANMTSGYWADHFAGHVRRVR